MIGDPAAFIRATTLPRAVPHAPEIMLHVAHEATELWEKTEEELGTIGLPPPFWALCLARRAGAGALRSRQTHVVRGRRVLDVASGSGLVAIAAALCGAARVTANDIDEFAVAAIGVNAALNGVSLAVRQDDLIGSDDGWDVVLAGDVSYERDMAAGMTAWLASLAARGATVLIGDPGRSYLARDRLEILATYVVPVTRALEDADVKQTSVWRFKAARHGSL